jgi:hypothetical protein
VADETRIDPKDFPPCDCWQALLGGAALSPISGHLADCPVHALIMSEPIALLGAREVTIEPGPGPCHFGIGRVESFDEVTEALNNGYPAVEHVDVQHWGPGPNLSPLPQLAEEFAMHSVQAERPVPAWEKHRLERKPDHDQPERIPLIVRVWSGRLQHRFEPFSDAPESVAVEVPVGWHLMPDHRAGVVLMNLWGDVLCAGDVLNWAETGSGSFRMAPKSVIEPGDATG